MGRFPTSASPSGPTDTIDARVYLGIHFRTADVQAVNLGRRVAVWAGKRYFQPTG